MSTTRAMRVVLFGITLPVADLEGFHGCHGTPLTEALLII